MAPKSVFADSDSMPLIELVLSNTRAVDSTAVPGITLVKYSLGVPLPPLPPLPTLAPFTIKSPVIVKSAPINTLFATASPPFTVSAPPEFSLVASVVDVNVADPLTVSDPRVPTEVIFG